MIPRVLVIDPGSWRADTIRSMVGTLRVPIVSMLAVRRSMPTPGGYTVGHAYTVDVARLSPEAVERAVQATAERNGVPIESVRRIGFTPCVFDGPDAHIEGGTT